MIYFYGCYYRRTLDGVGKTTICEQLCKELPFTYVKESYTNDNAEKQNRIKLMLDRIIEQKDYLYDRTTLIDDFVYNFLNESESPLSSYLDIIVAILSHCKIFHLRLDEETRRKRFEQRGDSYVTNDIMENVAAAYSKFYENLDNVEFFDLSGVLSKDVKKLVRRIENGRDFTHSTN